MQLLSLRVFYLQDECSELVPHVQLEAVSTSLAAGHQEALAGVGLDHRLGVLASLAQHESAEKESGGEKSLN